MQQGSYKNSLIKSNSVKCKIVLNPEYLPIVFETIGKMHPIAATFFEDTMKVMTENKGSYECSHGAAMASKSNLCCPTRFSCRIKKSIASSILSRSAAISGALPVKGVTLQWNSWRTYSSTLPSQRYTGYLNLPRQLQKNIQQCYIIGRDSLSRCYI